MGSPQPGETVRPVRSTRRLVVVLATVVLVVVVLPFAAWEAWWPTNVDARALDDFGPPFPGATPKGPDYVSEGNLLCFDVCTRLTRPYAVPPSLTLGQVLDDAERAVRRAGYQKSYAPNCMVTDPARAGYECSISAQGPQLNVIVSVVGTDSSVVTPTSIDGLGLPRLPDATPVTEVRVEVAKG